MPDLVQKIKQAGVVGAGGAGFPTYQKIDAQVEIVIANGAECEPLLFKDRALMEHYPEQIIDGMRQVIGHTGARQGIIAIKAKNREAIAILGERLPGNITLFEMRDVYPSGDEYEVVYHSTGRRIPAGGLPLEIGVVVQNVETLYNISRAAAGRPVTHSILSVHGHVRNPVTAWAPIGMLYADVLDLAGGPTIDDFVLLDGGPMMGKVVTDLQTPVTRLTSGLIVLPRDNKLVVRKSQSEAAYRRFGKSACDQCSLCTEMCPRYLLGYPIQPHLVMRSLLTSREMSQTLTHWAQACCECNICSLWACPEELDPRNVCVTTKRDLKENGNWLPPDKLQQMTREVHPLQEFRGVPSARLERRLGLNKFEHSAPLVTRNILARRVTIPLQQHIGAPPRPVVGVGDRVSVGDLLAEADTTGLSVPVHASITGTVTDVRDVITLER